MLLPRPVHEVAAKRLLTVRALSGQLKTWQHTRSLVLLFSLFIAASKSVCLLHLRNYRDDLLKAALSGVLKQHA